jgi:hypothetical protein
MGHTVDEIRFKTHQVSGSNILTERTLWHHVNYYQNFDSPL